MEMTLETSAARSSLFKISSQKQGERRCVRNLSLGSGVCHRPVKYTSWLEELSLELVRGRYGLCQLLSEAREQIGGVRSRDGAGIEIALPQNAAEIEQHLGLLVGFDTLG